MSNQSRIMVKLDMIQAEVAGIIEHQIPLAVGSDSPADISLYFDSVFYGSLHLFKVFLNIFHPAPAVRFHHAAVLADNWIARKFMLKMHQRIVQSFGIDRRLIKSAISDIHQMLKTFDVQA